MKSIHAISTILAICSIGPSARAAAFHAPSQARPTGFRAKNSNKGGGERGANAPFGRVNLQQSRAGIPTLLAVGLLQGGSPTERRRN
jgi:hypothetical protein